MARSSSPRGPTASGRSPLIAAALALAPALLAAQGLPTGPGSAAPFALPPEAPASLFSTKLGEGSAEFLARGAWELGLKAGAGLRLDSAGGLGLGDPPYAFFAQRPDLFLSFLLFERVFVEARVGEDLAQARYVLGYREELPGGRRELRVGNDGISFPALPRLGFGEGPRSSFGLAGSWSEGPFAASLMLRYDQAVRRSLRVYGGREIVESPISPASFIRGRFFVLPPGTFEDFALFARSDSGTLLDEEGRRYRRLEASEYRLARSTGELELAKAAESALYVAHAGILGPGDARVGGREALLVYSPDSWPVGGFERLSRYSLPARGASGSKEAGALEALLTDAATGLPDDSYRLRVDPEGFLEVLRAADLPVGSPLSLRPFADLMPWLYTERPDPGAEERRPYAPAYAREITLREHAAAEGIVLGQGYLPGSVQVLRDGLPDLSFRVDPATRALSLSRPPALAERIEVSWLEASEERRSGSLAAGLGLVARPDKDTRAYAALGGRLSLPGAGYAASDSLDPGEAVIVAGAERLGAPLSYELGLAARWSTPLLSGLYRIAGMEEGGVFGSAFRPAAGSTGGEAAETAEADAASALAAGFPAEIARLHPGGATNKVLALRATAAAATPAFIRYVEPAPLASLGVLSFYAKGPAGASLDLSLEGAEGRRLRLVLPPGSLSPVEWRRFSLRYAAAEPSVAYRAPGGAPAPLPGAQVEAPASLVEAGLLRIELSGLSAGEVVLVDEILLEEGRGAGALLGDAAVGLALPGLLVGDPALPLLKGLTLSLSGSGAVQDSAYARGELRVASQVSLAAIGLDARLAADGGGGLGWKLGHRVELPAGASAFGLAERFDYDPGDGAFGREESLRLAAWKLARLEAKARLEWRPLPGASGRLAQEWSGKAALLEGLVLDLAASQAARPAWSGLGAGGDYASAWLYSHPYLLPSFESSASERKLGAAATLSLPFPGARRKAEGWELAIEPRRLFGAKLQLSEDLSGPGLRRGELAASLSLPLDLPGGLRIELGYGREATWSQSGGGEGLLPLAAESLEILSAFPELLLASPLAELGLAGSTAPLDSWRAAAAARGRNLSALSYVPRLGLGASRPLGGGWAELLAPASFQASVARRLGYEKETGLEALEIEGKLGFAAINLFGLLGSSPIFDFYESEEYSAGLTGKLRIVPGDSAPELSVAHRLSLVVYVQDPATAGSTPTSLSLDNAASFAAAPSGSTWSEKLELAYSVRREEHWLLALFGFLVEGLRAGPVGVARAGNPEGSERRALSSAWLEGLRAGRPRAREAYALAVELSGASSRALPSVRLRESYEARLSLPRALSAQAKLEASQSYDGASGGFELGLALTLAATLQF